MLVIRTFADVQRAIDLLGRGLELRVVDTEPSPKPDHAIVYLRLNGSGKTELCVQHPTGTPDILSTEP